MKKIKILHKTPKGRIIGRTDRQPPLNAIVFLKTGDKTKLGKIYDVFGPVNKPYVEIIPFNSKVGSRALEVGEAIISDAKRGQKKRYKKRSR
ncbi:Gar1/Naf1 family protein [Methanothermococcus okinawensis]|uniref:H/ACA RNA-protein complex component Gar1 n=1 Tax=Methanothermococcus okinawensis (strain DSM 14208 / JCM 11175 / IH1) TaxID=647113 RepID=F8AM16_METOI|nr:Gar1/Naf1 family protein [Methanothermococcus okinawensis]AEH06695.1 H/ACA RNA-protein complex component Gar1 [Methanothermococcus okinawensis IH1]